MIIIQLTGGLGNQMFQYALGLRLSLIHKTPLLLDVTSFGWDSLRRYELAEVFDVTEEFADVKTIETCRARHRYHFMARVKRKIRGGEFPYYLHPKVNEPSFRFDPNMLKISDNTYVSGHFQSELYFQDIADRVRHRFHFIREPNEYYLGTLQRLQGKETVSVHIRRGDYVLNPETAMFHGSCLSDYYNSAMQWMREKVSNPVFVFISDDIAWTKQEFAHIADAVFIENNQGSAYEDMRMMSLCRHNIIANSSFSWWGAWLNANSQKQVVAPLKWFANPVMQGQTESIYPISWKKV